MNQKHCVQLNFILNRIPIVGIVLFILLYLYSASNYPGGSQDDVNSIGFDWFHNYWCNLMGDKAINGSENFAQTPAIITIVVLCFSLFIFFFQFAKVFSKSKVWQKIIVISGFCSMLFAALLFTSYHDLFTLLSSVFGVFVVVGVIREIYLSKMKFFQLSGLFCILLLVLNNYIYYSQDLIYFLPLIQKITFVLVLSWIAGLSYQIIRLENH